MSIIPIGYSNRFNFNSKTKGEKSPNKTLTDRINENNEKVLKYPPVVIGLMSAGCWASVGYIGDKFFSMLLGSKTKSKTSMVINGLIGCVMGTYTYLQAKKMQKATKEA